MKFIILLLGIASCIFLKLDYTPVSSNCTCECNVNQINFIDPYSGGGYGKYCGCGYTCGNATEPGCDPVDECCRLHDICVGKYGYCSKETCDCNISLVDCVADKIGPGFAPCYKMQEAKKIIIEDICDIIMDAPVWCAGCNKSDIPAICLNGKKTMLLPPG